MANRRKLNPQIYGKVISIHFELDKERYKALNEHCSKYNFSPNEYAKTICELEINNIIKQNQQNEKIS
jgi:hypothetical protein